jgi:hypothetical protein
MIPKTRWNLSKRLMASQIVENSDTLEDSSEERAWPHAHFFVQNCQRFESEFYNGPAPTTAISDPTAVS